MTEEKKNPTRLKKLAERAKKRSQWDIPHWVIALLVVCGVIALTGLIYGVASHLSVKRKVARWTKLLERAQTTILRLQTEKETIRLKTVREMGTKAVKLSEKKVNEIDKKLAKLKEKEKRIVKKVDGMTPDQLLEEFRREGFGGGEKKEPEPMKTKAPPPPRKEPPKREPPLEPPKDTGCGG